MSTLNNATWDYVSGDLTEAGTVSIIGHCTGLRVINTHEVDDAYFTVQSGDNILVKPGREVYINSGRKIKNPVVTWVSGTMNVFIEVIK